MAWETFQITVDMIQPTPTTVADGQIQLTYTITNNVMQTGAQLQYSPSAATPPPNPTTILTTTATISLVNGVYALPDTNLPNKFNIPPKGNFKGGNYNQMINATYNPTTNTLQGTFKVQSPTGDDDDCDWSAEGGSK